MQPLFCNRCQTPEAECRVKRTLALNAGGRRIGETHHRAKLTDEEVMTVLELRDYGLSYEQIAAKWDAGVKISKSTVRDICKGLIRAQIPCGWKVVRLANLSKPHVPGCGCDVCKGLA